MTTIADCLAPEVLEQLGVSFREGLDEFIAPTRGWDCSEYIEQTVGLTTGEHLWHTLWLFGIVVDEGTLCESTIVNPSGIADLSYYIPSDHLEEVDIIQLGVA